MVVTLVEPTKWADLIEEYPDTLYSSESAKNVENVLSKTSTRRHQKVLFNAAKPFMPKMIHDCIGTSILNSLVKYGTVTTVDGVCKIVFESCEKILRCRCSPENQRIESLGSLLERIVYRYDCLGNYRQNIIEVLKSLRPSQLMGTPVLLLAAARLLIQNRDFASLVLTNSEARTEFFSVSLVRTNRGVVSAFCKILLSEDALKDGEMTGLCSAFIFDSFSGLYEPKATLRPMKDITLLLASCGSIDGVRNLGKSLARWPDIHGRAKGDDYAKIVAHILSRLPDTDSGLPLVKAVLHSEEDINDRLRCRKSSHLHLLASIAEKQSYVQVLSEALGTSVEKKLASAVVQYRRVTKPRVVSTKELLSRKLADMRKGSGENDSARNVSKRFREW
ncbi:hypothetical protein, conserved [Trypanosoma brucei gambiense DAL972]|uniref:Uncharacterized protein n=2 Tax=Trypanosoma brucei TaxID=5691 RepID=C9ZJL0_TRYB9|nr:hypothetical protein, conserved [Trypanosoma brucei gambiense DAL972]RHW73956.1 hypothetical protein DPX39_020022600 [Trypanosoma brucei equiperdum]CBH09569.1 hypothetical protein, conserved [Trypanosoma brucei gambiense DAL972]|eukprot:XP_011771874.1 hypothetical protein, conserved [Trypanosoma brucei gambiense DAL972]